MIMVTNPPPTDADLAGHDGSDADLGTGGVGGTGDGGLDRIVSNPPPDVRVDVNTTTDGDDASDDAGD